MEALQARGHVKASVIDYGSKQLRNTTQVFQDFYADLETIHARKVIAEAYESFSVGTEGGLNSA